MAVVQHEIESGQQVLANLKSELEETLARLTRARQEAAGTRSEVNALQQRLTTVTQELAGELDRLEQTRRAAESADRHAKETRARVQREARRVADLAAAAVMAAAAGGVDTGEYRLVTPPRRPDGSERHIERAQHAPAGHRAADPAEPVGHRPQQPPFGTAQPDREPAADAAAPADAGPVAAAQRVVAAPQVADVPRTVEAPHVVDAPRTVDASRVVGARPTSAGAPAAAEHPAASDTDGVRATDTDGVQPPEADAGALQYAAPPAATGDDTDGHPTAGHAVDAQETHDNEIHVDEPRAEGTDGDGADETGSGWRGAEGGAGNAVVEPEADEAVPAPAARGGEWSPVSVAWAGGGADRSGPSAGNGFGRHGAFGVPAQRDSQPGPVGAATE